MVLRFTSLLFLILKIKSSIVEFTVPVTQRQPKIPIFFFPNYKTRFVILDTGYDEILLPALETPLTFPAINSDDLELYFTARPNIRKYLVKCQDPNYELQYCFREEFVFRTIIAVLTKTTVCFNESICFYTFAKGILSEKTDSPGILGISTQSSLFEAFKEKEPQFVPTLSIHVSSSDISFTIGRPFFECNFVRLETSLFFVNISGITVNGESVSAIELNKTVKEKSINENVGFIDSGTTVLLVSLEICDSLLTTVKNSLKKIDSYYFEEKENYKAGFFCVKEENYEELTFEFTNFTVKSDFRNISCLFKKENYKCRKIVCSNISTTVILPIQIFKGYEILYLSKSIYIRDR